MVTRNITIVMRLVDKAWNKGDATAVDELVANGITAHDSLVAESPGRDAFRHYLGSFRCTGACPTCASPSMTRDLGHVERPEPPAAARYLSATRTSLMA